MTDHVYFVMARGIYEHGPLGVYRTEAEARARAEQHSRYPALQWDYFGDDENNGWDAPIDPNKPYTGLYNGDGRHDYVVYRAAFAGDPATAVSTLEYDIHAKAYDWQDGRGRND